MRSYTVKLPSFLASALVNGDLSGLECRTDAPWPGAPSSKTDHSRCKVDLCDFAALEAVERYVAPGHIVSCEDARFSWFCVLPDFTLGADMQTYTVLYPEEL